MAGADNLRLKHIHILHNDHQTKLVAGSFALFTVQQILSHSPVIRFAVQHSIIPLVLVQPGPWFVTPNHFPLFIVSLRTSPSLGCFPDMLQINSVGKAWSTISLHSVSLRTGLASNNRKHFSFLPDPYYTKTIS